MTRLGYRRSCRRFVSAQCFGRDLFAQGRAMTVPLPAVFTFNTARHCGLPARRSNSLPQSSGSAIKHLRLPVKAMLTTSTFLGSFQWKAPQSQPQKNTGIDITPFARAPESSTASGVSPVTTTSGLAVLSIESSSTRLRVFGCSSHITRTKSLC